MKKLMIINGSPRAPRSNSKKYVELFKEFWNSPAEEYSITEKNYQKAWGKIKACTDVLFAFPLYVDGLPAALMAFLKDLEQDISREGLCAKPVIHVLINCGFLEPEQNFAAVEMIKYFAKRNSLPYGMTLCIGSGEAILTTPFAGLVKPKLKKLSLGIRAGKSKLLKTTMPLPKRLFVKASTGYWIKYGQKNGVSEEEMRTMEIERETFV